MGSSMSTNAIRSEEDLQRLVRRLMNVMSNLHECVPAILLAGVPSAKAFTNEVYYQVSSLPQSQINDAALMFTITCLQVLKALDRSSPNKWGFSNFDLKLYFDAQYESEILTDWKIFRRLWL